MIFDANLGICIRGTTVSSDDHENKRPRVLILDEAQRSAPMIEVLMRAEFEVLHARDPDEAWAMLQAGEDVDVLLADIDLPGAIRGVELGRYVHDRWPALGLVLTSDQVRHLRPDEVPDDACFLPKPVPADTLLAEIKSAVRRP
jgi:DNA-binding NtrC family response regulator